VLGEHAREQRVGPAAAAQPARAAVRGGRRGRQAGDLRQGLLSVAAAEGDDAQRLARVPLDLEHRPRRLDAQAVVDRAAKAESDRTVTIRPAPDTMAYVTVLLPVAKGVGAYAALKRAADTTFDDRSRGQVMADTFFERVTGQPADIADAVAVNLVIDSDTIKSAAVRLERLQGSRGGILEQERKTGRHLLESIHGRRGERHDRRQKRHPGVVRLGHPFRRRVRRALAGPCRSQAGRGRPHC